MNFIRSENRGIFFLFQATVLKFGNLLGMEVSIKYKISAQYL